MDSFEWNKIIGAVLGTVIFVFVVREVAENIYDAPMPAKPGYVVEGVVEPTASGAPAAPVVEAMPDFGTVLASADAAQGKTVSTRCEQCHDISKGGPNKIGPELYGVIGRPRATEAGFSYSSAMSSTHTPWTFADLFRYLKSPQIVVPGTKMAFAGLPRAEDRINLIAFLRTQSDSPVAIPAPQPVAAAPAAAPAGAPAAAGAAPADTGKTASAPSNTNVTAKPATPAAGAAQAGQAPAPATSPAPPAAPAKAAAAPAAPAAPKK